nr:sperm-activating 9-peptide [Hemicentrotus pulcherrimus]
GFDLTGGGV